MQTQTELTRLANNDKNMAVDRKEMAKVYRLKSDESYEAAQECLRKQLYRATCNRSWYSVMQIITAAVYEDLNELPANDKPNWTHERQSSLFRNLVKKHKVWQEHHALAAEIDMMRERRNDADYFAPHELHANSQAAERSLAVAGKVRAVIFQLMSENWSSQMTSVKDGKG